MRFSHEIKVLVMGSIIVPKPGVLPMQSSSEDVELPLTINCWPSTSGSETYVNIEYESNTSLELHDVNIAIPLPPLSSGPRINQVCLQPKDCLPNY